MDVPSNHNANKDSGEGALHGAACQADRVALFTTQQSPPVTSHGDADPEASPGRRSHGGAITLRP